MLDQQVLLVSREDGSTVHKVKRDIPVFAGEGGFFCQDRMHVSGPHVTFTTTKQTPEGLKVVRNAEAFEPLLNHDLFHGGEQVRVLRPSPLLPVRGPLAAPFWMHF